MEDAYTSPSTAENHIVSENEHAKAPTDAEPTMAIISAIENSSPALVINFFATIAITKYKNNTHAADINADRKLTIITGFDGLNKVKILPNIMNSGAPGGCATCSLYTQETNSPQSHKLPADSMVEVYCQREIAKTIKPTTAFINLYCLFIQQILDKNIKK